MINPVSQTKNKRLLSIVVLPLAGCMLSSVVGIILGQVGNLLYKALGAAGSCLAIPGFLVLFLMTFGLSFSSSKLLQKLLISTGK